MGVLGEVGGGLDVLLVPGVPEFDIGGERVVEGEDLFVVVES